MPPLPPTPRLAATAVIGGQVGALLGLIVVGTTLLAPLGTALLGALVGPAILVARQLSSQARLARDAKPPAAKTAAPAAR
jgi:hypothetical protein